MSPASIEAMLIGDVRTRNPVHINRDATILVASNLMRLYRVDELVVTEAREGKLLPVGILSARDIVTRIIATELDAAVLTVGDMMWSAPTGIRVTDSAAETLRVLDATRSPILPVIDAEGVLVGVVSRADLLSELVRN